MRKIPEMKGTNFFSPFCPDVAYIVIVVSYAFDFVEEKNQLIFSKYGINYIEETWIFILVPKIYLKNKPLEQSWSFGKKKMHRKALAEMS